MTPRILLGTILALLPAAFPAAAAEAVDLDRLLAEVRAVQDADLGAWSRYRFHRSVSRTKLDAAGDPRRTTELEFVVTPAGEGFDERLALLDGEPPAASEVDRYRRRADFTRHYAALVLGEEGDGGFTVRHLLERSEFRYGGRETLDGVRCHRLDFSPRPPGRGDLAERIADSMAGSLWISVDGLHLARASARMMRPVSAAGFLVRISEVRLHLESRPVRSGAWLPRRIEVQTEARILGVSSRRRNVYRYSRFVPLRMEPERPSGTPLGSRGGGQRSAPGVRGPGRSPNVTPTEPPRRTTSTSKRNTR